MKKYVDKDKLQEFATKLNERQKSIFATKSEIGSPLVASTAAAMTDTNKIYVYVGSESGYTSGNWYYYNGSTWISGGIYNSTAFETDTTLSLAGMAADAKVTGDKIFNLESAIAVTGVNSMLSQLPKINGFITSTGKWNYTTNANYKYICIPISGGETLSLVGNSNRSTYYSVLKTYSTPTDNTNVDFSAETGWTGRIQINTNAIHNKVLPSDGRYLIITVLNNNNESTPTKIVIDNYDITLTTMADALKKYINAQDDVVINDSKVRELNLFSVDGIDAPIIWEVGSVNTTAGEGHPVPDYETNTRWRGKGIYQFNEPMDVTCDATYYYQVYLLDASGNLVSTAFATFSSQPYTIPAKTSFRIVVGKRDNSDISSVDITQYISVKFNAIKDTLYHDNGVRWCAMGDSITEGYYSYYNDQDAPASAQDVSKAWVTKVAAENKWNVTNLGDGGTGWLDEDEHGGCAYKLARATDFSGYNLVTLAYGINDWKGNAVVHTTDDIPAEIAADVSEVSTPTTVIQAMKITIEAILASNPKCKVIGILPINCSKYGTKAGNYGLGYSFPNTGTLESFCEVLIKIYEYYGIQYIDMAHASVVNRENIETLLIDGVHPSEDCYTLMAHELSKKITF